MPVPQGDITTSDINKLQPVDVELPEETDEEKKEEQK